MLPAPSSERWKPLRAGLVDMFYYDQEEFWFHDGRLLLRGKINPLRTLFGRKTPAAEPARRLLGREASQ